MATLEDISVTKEKVVGNVFPDPPPAALDPRACRLAVRTLNRKPPVDDIVHMAALSILAVDTDVPSPPATPLLSQMLLLPPMIRDAGEGFLLVSVTQRRRTTPSELAVQYLASVEMVPTNLFGALSMVSS